MSKYIDIEQIEQEDNQEYEYGLFRDLLKSLNIKTDLPVQFYYQYEYDSNETTYEQLMGKHLIAIKAHSLEEANVLNVILRVIIDYHGGSLHMFTSDDNDNPIQNLTEEEFFNSIKNNGNLTIYEGYVSDTLKPISKNEFISKKESISKNKYDNST